MTRSTHPHGLATPHVEGRITTRYGVGHGGLCSFLRAAVVLVICVLVGCDRGPDSRAERSQRAMGTLQLTALAKSGPLEALRLSEGFHLGPYPALPRRPVDACAAVYLDRHTRYIQEILRSTLARDALEEALGSLGVEGDTVDAGKADPFWSQYGDLYRLQENGAVHSLGFVEFIHVTDAAERSRNADRAGVELLETVAHGGSDTTLVVRVHVDVSCDRDPSVYERRYRVDHGRLRTADEYHDAVGHRVAICPDTARVRHRPWYRISSRCR